MTPNHGTELGLCLLNFFPYFLSIRGILIINHNTSKMLYIVFYSHKYVPYFYKAFFSLFLEALLLEKSPAIAVDYLYILELPDDFNSERLSELGSDLEYRYRIKCLPKSRWTVSCKWSALHLLAFFVPATCLKSLCAVWLWDQLQLKFVLACSTAYR